MQAEAMDVLYWALFVSAVAGVALFVQLVRKYRQ